MKVFIIECVDPMDLLLKRSEGNALEQVCRLIGYDTAILTAFSKDDLVKYCNYISSIDSAHDTTSRPQPLCIHLSTHGNKQGIGLGSDFVDWSDLYKVMRPIFTEMHHYKDQVFISISSCDAGYQELANELEKAWSKSSTVTPPGYIFVTSERRVKWDDAMVAWTLLYHRLSKRSTIRRNDVKQVIQDISQAVGTDLKYFRWDETEYRYLYYDAHGSK